MSFAYDTKNESDGFIDGDNTKTLSVNAAAVAGRVAIGLVWAHSGADAGIGMTYAGNAMTAMSLVTSSIVSGTPYRGYYLSGDSNVPSGTQNFVLTASSQISTRVLVVIANGLITASNPIIGTPQYGNVSSTAVTVGGHASWAGSVAFAIGFPNTGNFSTLSNGTGTTIDVGATPASPQGFAAHRPGGNVAVNIVSDHSDEFVLLGLSLNDGSGGGASAILNIVSQYHRQMRG